MNSMSQAERLSAGFRPSRNRLQVARAAWIALAALLALPSAAAAAGLTLETASYREVVVTAPDGRKEKRLEVLSSAFPGQEVVFVTRYVNTDDKPADKVVIRNPLPEGMQYRAGSAEGAGTKVDVSVDGGKEYGVLAILSVRDEKGKLRAARPEDVTHVRWTLTAPLKAGGAGQVSYRAALK